MRTIKFRAWYKIMRRWADAVVVYGDGSWDAQFDLVSGFTQEDGVELMQFTSLRDRNGKDVYEGDIIREGHGDIWAIRWAGHLARFALYSRDITKLGGNKEWRYEDSLGSLTMASACEVIGNIYEHPALLETDIDA